MIKEAFLKYLNRNSFIKNVATLATGSVISQAIVVLVAPILTRYYPASSFGLLSLFTSTSVFLAVITTGRYELVIPMPKRDSSAIAIIALIVRIATIVSLFYLISLFIIYKFGFIDVEILKNKTLFLSPLYIFLLGIFSAFGYWLQRKLKYKELAISNAIQAISTAISSVFFGLFGILETGMILSLIIGVICSILYIFRQTKFIFKLNYSTKYIRKVAYKYSSFPKYLILSDLSLAASQQFVPIFFSFLFSIKVLGYYALANRFLRLPVIVLASSISNVYKNELIAVANDPLKTKQLFRYTLKKLVIISAGVLLVSFSTIPWAFTFFFGEEWRTSGEMAKILLFIILSEFIAIPLNSIFYIKGKQKVYMNIQLVLLALSLLSLYLGKEIFNSPYYSLVLLACVTVIVNFLSIILSSKLLNKQ